MTDIRTYAEELADDMTSLLAGETFEEEEPHDYVAGWLLDVEHTSRVPDNIPETTVLLLGVGGPTVFVTYSHRFDAAELTHTFGTFEGENRTTWHLPADIVSDFIATFCPHPHGEDA